MAPEPQVPVGEWIAAIAFWLLIGATGFLFPVSVRVASAAKLLAWLFLMVHLGEALFAGKLARRLGYPPLRWFFRTVVLGLFAWTRLRQAELDAAMGRRAEG